MRILQYAALDLFVLEFPTEANLLLDAVHEHVLDTTTRDFYGRTTERQLSNARDVSGILPAWKDRRDNQRSDAARTEGFPSELAKKAAEETLKSEDTECARKIVKEKCEDNR